MCITDTDRLYYIKMDQTLDDINEQRYAKQVNKHRCDCRSGEQETFTLLCPESK